jgi:hypothetical protein
MIVQVCDEIIHLVDILVHLVPDIQESLTGIVEGTTFADVHYIIRSHGSIGDKPGGTSAIAVETFIGNTADVAFLEWIRETNIQPVHIRLGEGITIEYGLLSQFIQRLLVQEIVVATDDKKRKCNYV